MLSEGEKKNVTFSRFMQNNEILRHVYIKKKDDKCEKCVAVVNPKGCRHDE